MLTMVGPKSQWRSKEGLGEADTVRADVFCLLGERMGLRHLLSSSQALQRAGPPGEASSQPDPGQASPEGEVQRGEHRSTMADKGPILSAGSTSLGTGLTSCVVLCPALEAALAASPPPPPPGHGPHAPPLFWPLI